jgi:hypothetical protein
MAEEGEALPWRAGSGGRLILVSRRRRPVGKQRLEHVGGAGAWALKRGCPVHRRGPGQAE